MDPTTAQDFSYLVFRVANPFPKRQLSMRYGIRPSRSDKLIDVSFYSLSLPGGFLQNIGIRATPCDNNGPFID
jgi:hypothetical protein